MLERRLSFSFFSPPFITLKSEPRCPEGLLAITSFPCASLPSLELYEVGRVDREAMERVLPPLAGFDERVHSERDEAS
jgi:hypothetical protein